MADWVGKIVSNTPLVCLHVDYQFSRAEPGVVDMVSLSDHAQPGTRILHFLGTGLGVAALILGIVMLDPMIAILGMLMGYVCAWSGHLLIERNRPSMLAVCTENLNPDVVVMKSAKDRVWTNDSDPLNGARDRRIFIQ